MIQHLGLFVILLTALGLAFTVVKWPGEPHMTFSQHAAANRSSKIYYSLLFLVVLPLLYLFFAAWLVPNKHLSGAFLWFSAVSVLLQITCTWFPDQGGTKTIIHRLLTGLSGITLLPMLVKIATNQSISTLEQKSAWFAIVVMVILLIVALKNRNGYRYALLLQIGYYASFFAVILLLTYA